MTQGPALGIDIGGTAIKLGIMASDGTILARDAFPFDHALDFDALMQAIVDRGEMLARQNGTSFHAVGISLPGFVDPKTGIVVDGANNVPILRGQPFAKALARRMGRPVAIDNDALAAARCELRFGAGRAFARFVLITLGTGIGGAVVLDRQILRGPRGEPPEFGALVLDPAGERNYSGLPGTFEHLANGAALVRSYRARLSVKDQPVTPAEVIERARHGDPAAEAAIENVARWIAQAIGTMINLLNPDACIIGGGIAAAGEVLLAPIRRELPNFTWATRLSQTSVVLAERGNEAGFIGAAALALEEAATSAD